MRGRDAGSEVEGYCRGYFRDARVEFVPRKEFYYSWKVSGDSVSVQISDYMEGCPSDVMADFCGMVCRRARKLAWSEPPSVTGYLRSDGFILRNRPVYIRRSRNLLGTDHGENAELSDSVQRLLDSGLLIPEDIANSYMSWTTHDSRRHVGFCSTMFRVVGISAVLDSPGIPEDVRDYVVYHECLHLRQGYQPGNRYHDPEFRSWERSYPGWRDAETFLRRL